MNIIKGDLIKLALDGNFDVIVHGCNCFCTMGAGIAKSIKHEFSEAFAADCNTEKGSESKLGSYSYAIISMGERNIIVVNAYTQHHYKGKGVKSNYEAIRSVFNSIKMNYSGKRIGYPKIGAGLACGNWEIISKIIDETLGCENYTLVEFSP